MYPAKLNKKPDINHKLNIYTINHFFDILSNFLNYTYL